jgi:invasion protein IalB
MRHCNNAGGCLLSAGLAALAAGLVQLASTVLAAITLHATAVVQTSTAHLNHLAWISVCAQPGTVWAPVALVNCVLWAHSGQDLPRPLLTLVKGLKQQLQLKN